MTGPKIARVEDQSEILRILCHRIPEEKPDQWAHLVDQIGILFGVELCEPQYVEERGELTMDYRERGSKLDLSSSRRGLQQTLLILSFMYAHPGSVILLDEPDAHLEVLRQRQMYRLMTDTALSGGNQLIVASHSEILLNEATGKDTVIAFTGTPHRIPGDQRQLRKALTEIGFEQYIQAELAGWVLYLEGPSDLAIQSAFAERLDHQPAQRALHRPFVRYVGNQLNHARHHYCGLRDALPGLQGIAILGRLERPLPDRETFTLMTWQRREIENYVCTPSTLQAYASHSAVQDWPGPLFESSAVQTYSEAMRESVAEISGALDMLGRGSAWDGELKVSEKFLEPVFRTYHQKLELKNVMPKRQFHELARFVPRT